MLNPLATGRGLCTQTQDCRASHTRLRGACGRRPLCQSVAVGANHICDRPVAAVGRGHPRSAVHAQPVRDHAAAPPRRASEPVAGSGFLELSRVFRRLIFLAQSRPYFCICWIKFFSTSDLLDCASAQTLTEWLGAHQFFDTIAADEAVFWLWLESVADQQRTDANEQSARDHAFAVYADSLAAADNASAVASSTAASATASVASASALANAALTAPAAAPPPTAISTAQLRAEVESLLRARVSQQPALMAAWRHLVAASSSASATPSSSAPMSADELSALAAAQTDELDAFAADFCVGAVAVRSAARHSVAALSGATVVGGAPLVASSSTFSHSNRHQHQQQGTVFVTWNVLLTTVFEFSIFLSLDFEMFCHPTQLTCWARSHRTSVR
jgi:hypothetical protein